jgi:hypothetical protein
VLAFLFLGAAEPPCAASADSNDDGRIELADALLLLSFLFLGGRAPATPFPACGTEPTPDSLRCDEFPACTGA